MNTESPRCLASQAAGVLGRKERMVRSYKPRSSGKRGASAVVLTVPMDIARVLPENAEFTPELTEEGILYRLIDPQAPQELPPWVNPRDSS